MSGPVRRLGGSHRPAGRALAGRVWMLGIEVAQAHVDDVGAGSRAARALDELLDLGAVPVDEHRPAGASRA